MASMYFSNSNIQNASLLFYVQRNWQKSSSNELQCVHLGENFYLFGITLCVCLSGIYEKHLIDKFLWLC